MSNIGRPKKKRNEQCRSCQYYDKFVDCCCYAIYEEKSRIKMHEGEGVDINDPCREYVQKTRSRDFRFELRRIKRRDKNEDY